MCGKCNNQDHNTKVCKEGKPKLSQVNALATVVQTEIQKALAAPPVEPSEIASYAFRTYGAFAMKPSPTTCQA